MRFVALILALLSVTSASLSAGRVYAQACTRPYAFQLGAELVEPIAATRDRFSTGFGISLGVTLRPLSALGVQLAYAASMLDVRSGVLPGARLEGDQMLQAWSLSLVLTPLRGPRAGIYALLGPGLYVRHVDITSVRGGGVAAICDAWLLLCGDNATDIQDVPGTRNAIDFGVHGGIGIDVAMDARTRLFFEVRYAFLWGDDLHSRAGMVSHANQDYVSLVLGVDF